MINLNDLTSPKKVAIVGASNDPSRIGGRPISYMLNSGFAGDIYPVNPKYKIIQGIKSYFSIDQIPTQIDFVVIAVKASLVSDQIKAAAKKGAKTALIFSSGFSETGENGEKLQKELSAIKKETGIRIIGPNCLGIFNSFSNFFPTFSAAFERAKPNPGGVAIVSQSGAYAAHIYMVCHSRGINIGHWITTGNEVDLEVAEIIKLMSEDENVSTILAYIESIKDGELMIDALKSARENKKPVIVTKVGSSKIGAQAAISHTASLAGEDAIYDAILKQYGAFRVSSTEEMSDIAIAVQPRIFPIGKKLGLVTVSGGAGILMADEAEVAGLDVSPMPEEAQRSMKEIIPFSSPKNPVDTTAQFFNDLSVIPKFTKTMLDIGGYDGIIGFWTSVAGNPTLGKPLLNYLKETMKDYNNRLFMHVLLASEEIRREYESSGFPTFTDPSRAIMAMKAAMFFGNSFNLKNKKELNFKQNNKNKLPLPKNLNEKEVKDFLNKFDIPTTKDFVARNKEDAVSEFKKINNSVAMKILSKDILHKTDFGGVKLNLNSSIEVEETFEFMIKNVREKIPNAKIDGVIINPMIDEGVDLILGYKKDPIFGPIMMLGFGGIYAEILKDVKFCKLPLDQKQIVEMIKELKLFPILNGARGGIKYNLDELSCVIQKISNVFLLYYEEIKNMEINPLRVNKCGILCVDALLENN